MRNTMRTRKHIPPIPKWGLTIFAGLVVIINAILTFVFSAAHLPAAFGAGATTVTIWLAGFYGLLMMDIGYLTWFAVYMKVADGRQQRNLALLMAIASLLSSTIATINQLATNAYGLVDLSGYEETVGFIALGAMILITALHIISAALFTYFDPDENLINFFMDKGAELAEDVRDDVAARLQAKRGQYVDALAEQAHYMLLDQLGLDRTGTRVIGDGTGNQLGNTRLDDLAPRPAQRSDVLRPSGPTAGGSDLGADRDRPQSSAAPNGNDPYGNGVNQRPS